jgi:hypothetical protein
MSEFEPNEPLPQRYIDLTKNDKEYMVDINLFNMLKSPTEVTRVTPEYARDDGSGLLEGDGVFLADMSKLRRTNDNDSDKESYLEDFKKKYVDDFFINKIGYGNDKIYSTFVFIKVIEVTDGIFKFYAYHPNGRPIGVYYHEVSSANKHQSAMSVPQQASYELPLRVLTTDKVKLFKKIFPETHIPDAGGGGKLRSAKKTSKRRSVKSKPRYYRRSVGSINHRRKKTTRRRK